MVNYNTNLQAWGSSGSSPPSGYNYTKDEPPVDEWDNYTVYNSIEDLKHLISLTNSRIESDKGASGSEPPSPENSHFYFDEDNNKLEIYDSSSASWREVPYSSEVTSYTDTDAISAVDSTVDNSATSVAGLDDTVAGKSDEGHDHTEASETLIPDSGLVENYVTSTEASSYTDVDAISAVDGEVDNAATSVAGLDNAVANISTYSDSEAVTAVDGEVDNAATSISGLDDTVAGKASDNHENSSHSTNYLAQSNYNPEADSDLSNISASGDVNLSGNNLADVSQIAIDDQHSGGEQVAFATNGAGSILATMDKFHISSAGGGNANLRVNGSADIDGDLLVESISPDNNVLNVNENDIEGVRKIGFYWNGNIGFGWRPGDGFNVSDEYSINTYAGIEAGTSNQTADIFAGGDLKAQGNKTFVIEHPSDDTKKLNHSAYEGPVSGGLVYRDQVEVVDGTADMDLPDYVLNGEFGADWVQSVTPKKHFGTGYLDTDTWTVKADSDGTYDVIVMGQRTDSQGLAGLGGITTKNKDESWDEAADRFYNGATDVDGNEVATDDDEYRQTTLYAHAESQHESNQ